MATTATALLNNDEHSLQQQQNEHDIFSVVLSILLRVHPKVPEVDLEHKAHCFVDAHASRDTALNNVRGITSVAPALLRKPDNGVAFTSEWARMQKTDHMREHSYTEYRRSVESISDPYIFFASDPYNTFTAQATADTEVYIGGHDNHADDDKRVIRILEGTQVPISALRIPLSIESPLLNSEIVSFDASLYESFLQEMRPGGVATIKKIPDGGFFGNRGLDLLDKAIDVLVQKNENGTKKDVLYSLVKKGGSVLVKDCTKPWLDRYLVSSGPKGVEIPFTKHDASVLRWEIKSVVSGSKKTTAVPANWWVPRVADLTKDIIHIDSILHARQLAGFTHLPLEFFDYLRLRDRLLLNSVNSRNGDDVVLPTYKNESVVVDTVPRRISQILGISMHAKENRILKNSAQYYSLDISLDDSSEDGIQNKQLLFQGYLTKSDFVVGKHSVKVVPRTKKVSYWFPKWAKNRRYLLNNYSSVFSINNNEWRVISWIHTPSLTDTDTSNTSMIKNENNDNNDDNENDEDDENDEDELIVLMDDDPVFVVPIESISLYSVLSDGNESRKSKRFSGDLLIGDVARSSPSDILNSLLTPSLRIASRNDKVGFALWRTRALRCFEALASETTKALDKAVDDVRERRSELKERMLHRNLDKTMTFEEFEHRIIIGIRLRFIPEIVACMGAVVLMVDNDTKKVHANARALLRTYFAMSGESVDKSLTESLASAYKRCTDDPTLRMAARSWQVSHPNSNNNNSNTNNTNNDTVVVCTTDDSLDRYKFSDFVVCTTTDIGIIGVTSVRKGVEHVHVTKLLGDSDRSVKKDILKQENVNNVNNVNNVDVTKPKKQPSHPPPPKTFDDFLRALGGLVWGKESSSMLSSDLISLGKSEKGKAPAMWVKTMEMGSPRRASFLQIFSSASGPQSSRRMIAPDKALLKDILMFIRGTIVPIIVRGPSDFITIKKMLPSIATPTVTTGTLDDTMSPLVGRETLMQVERMAQESPEYAGTCATLCMNIVMEICLYMADKDMKPVAIALLKTWEYLTIFNRQDSQKDDDDAYAAERERVKRKKIAAMKGLLSVGADVDDEIAREFRALHGKTALKDINLDEIDDVNEDEMHSSLTTRSNEQETFEEGELDARDMYWGGDASDEGLSENLYAD